MPRKTIEDTEVTSLDESFEVTTETAALSPVDDISPGADDIPLEATDGDSSESELTASKRTTRRRNLIPDAEASGEEPTGPDNTETNADIKQPASLGGPSDENLSAMPPVAFETPDTPLESMGTDITRIELDDLPAETEIEELAVPSEVAPEPSAKVKPVSSGTRRKTIYDLNLNSLDRDLTPEEKQEWSSIYASYRAKSVLTGTVIGADENTFDVRNRETGLIESKTLTSLIIIDYRVKVLIPESEMWMPGEERPGYVLRNMTGSRIDYVIIEIDREGECAIGSRRIALAARRHYFATARGGHAEGELLKCRVLSTGPHRCTVEVGGYDIQLSQRDLCYTTVPDLREKFHPGQELSCRLKSYDRKEGTLSVSVKEAAPNPFIGADTRHPVGSRRQAIISGKYAGGVFCTLPDDTVCLCVYSAMHADMNFSIGDSAIIVIRSYDYDRRLIYGRILSKW